MKIDLSLHGISVKGIITWCLGAPVLYGIIFAIYLCVDYTYYRWLDKFENYVRYNSITFIGLTEDRQLHMNSYRDIYKPINLRWFDVLDCDLNGDGKFTYYSSHPSQWDYREPSIDANGLWVYPQRYPSNKLCYIHSNMTIPTQHGMYVKGDKKSEVFRTP